MEVAGAGGVALRPACGEKVAEGRMRGFRRIRNVIPHGIALIAYFALRRAVLGQFFGDYGWVVERGDRIRLLLTAPWIVIRSTAGPNVIVDVLFFALVQI